MRRHRRDVRAVNDTIAVDIPRAVAGVLARTQVLVYRLEVQRADDAIAVDVQTAPGRPKAYALFAHCFTCGKSLAAVRNIAKMLTAEGTALLRFDFTGLGQSEGNFAETSFTTDLTDIVAASHYLEREHLAPAVLIGHSLGGTAVLAAAHTIPSAKCVATIAAPAPSDVGQHWSFVSGS